MRMARPGSGFISSRGAKLLIGLPLLLAAFALTLQVSLLMRTNSCFDSKLCLVHACVW